MAKVTMRYWAAAKEAAGVAEEECAADTLAEALHAARLRRDGDERFAGVLKRCSFLVDGVTVGGRPHGEVRFDGPVEVEVLPPFAGG
jgi:sulfur-carrier protein